MDLIMQRALRGLKEREVVIMAASLFCAYDGFEMQKPQLIVIKLQIDSFEFWKVRCKNYGLIVLKLDYVFFGGAHHTFKDLFKIF